LGNQKGIDGFIAHKSPVASCSRGLFVSGQQ
jgi:hypothetical protein